MRRTADGQPLDLVLVGQLSPSKSGFLGTLVNGTETLFSFNDAERMLTESVILKFIVSATDKQPDGDRDFSGKIVVHERVAHDLDSSRLSGVSVERIFTTRKESLSARSELFTTNSSVRVGSAESRPFLTCLNLCRP